jgi:hypothetical protein
MLIFTFSGDVQKTPLYSSMTHNAKDEQLRRLFAAFVSIRWLGILRFFAYFSKALKGQHF